MTAEKGKKVSRKVMELRNKFIKACDKQLMLIEQGVHITDRRRWTFPYGDEIGLQLRYGVYELIPEALPCEDEEHVAIELKAARETVRDGEWDEQLIACSKMLSENRKK